MSLYLGVNYHPHDWDKQRWKTDIELMKEAGVEVVRIGHLAWDSFEPDEGVYTFEEYDEVMDLFPNAPYIHLGADEVVAEAWEHCALCKEYMAKHEIKDTQELYSDFVARVTNYVLEKGRRPIVWEGFRKEYSDRISKEVMHSRKLNPDIHKFIKGVMIESYIEEGCQKVGGGVYGKSITDPCLGWADTERLIYDLAEYE